jgi:hypothetical protein
MAYFQCPCCGERTRAARAGTARAHHLASGVQQLARLPLRPVAGDRPRRSRLRPGRAGDVHRSVTRLLGRQPEDGAQRRPLRYPDESTTTGCADPAADGAARTVSGPPAGRTGLGRTASPAGGGARLGSGAGGNRRQSMGDRWVLGERGLRCSGGVWAPATVAVGRLLCGSTVLGLCNSVRLPTKDIQTMVILGLGARWVLARQGLASTRWTFQRATRGLTCTSGTGGLWRDQ